MTLLGAVPGLEMEMVTSNARSGVHKRHSAEKWKVTTEGLELTERRGAGPGRSHDMR